MKYNQFTIKNQKGLYIKYGTAYSYDTNFTDSLYDAHLWNLKEGAKKLAEYMNGKEHKGLKVVMV